MTWGLFVHNVQVDPRGIGRPVDGTTSINAEDVLVGGSAISGVYEKATLKVGSGKVLATVDGEDFYVTYDAGDSWAKTGKVPRYADSAWSLALLDHQSRGDCWFLQIYRSASRGSEYYRSTDDGQNWSEIATSFTPQYNINSLMVDVSQNLILGNETGDLYVLASPESSDSSTLLSSNSYTRNCESLEELASSYIYSIWTGSDNHWIEIDKSTGSATYKSYNITDANTTSWTSNNDDICLVGATASGTSARYDIVTEGATSKPLVTFDMGENVGNSWFGWTGGYFLWAAPSLSDGDAWLLTDSDTGADGSWRSTPIRLQLEASHNSGARTRIDHYSGATWFGAYQDASGICRIMRFQYGEADGFVESEGALSREIRRQAPDIFLKLDDTGSPSSVTDIGRKGYTNAASGAITFEQSGLVDDGGTSALFGGGSIAVSVEATSATWTVDKSKQPILNGMANDGGQVYEGSRVGSLVATAKLGTPQYVSEAQYLQLIGLSSGLGGADDHVHVFVLSHDDTASSRTLLAYGDAWSVTVDADDKVSITDGTDTLTSSSAIAADTATLLIVSIEKQGGKVNLYLDDGHEGYDTLSIETPDTLDLVIGGAGITIDYYAMIPYGNADITAIQEAWGATPTAPDATGATVGDAKLIVRADSAASLVNVWHPDLEEWRDVYRIENYGSSDREVEWWQEGGSGIVDLTDGKFGGGCLSVPARPATGSYLPHKEPYWSGFHQLGVGTQDFTLAAWIKPGGNQAYVVSSQPYWRSGGIYHRYAGFTLTLVGDASGASLKLQVGHALNDALAGNGDTDALVLNFLGYPTFTPGAFNFVTLCRKNLKWYATVNGKLEGSRSLQGNLNAPVVMEPIYRAMHIGKYLKRYNGGADLASHCYAAKFDDVVFVLGEALYTQEFTPPTSRFEA